MLLSRIAVSEVTDRLWEDYQAFLARDLSGLSIHYLFCDVVVRHEAPQHRAGWKDPLPACRSRSVKLRAA